jgi:UrcA family protein
MGAMTAAQAEDGQMRVRLTGLNLATVAGATAALGRIRWSSGMFCDAHAGRLSLERGGAVDHCVGDMTRKSVAQLNAPLVTALLEDRGSQAQASAPMALVQN